MPDSAADPATPRPTAPLARTLLSWLVRRVVSAVVVVWLVATIVFFALRSTGDPIEAILGGPGSQAGPEAVAAARAQYGLDQPLLVQYALQLWRVATFQLGDSFARRQDVGDLLLQQLPPTLLLASLALALAWALALCGAALSASARGRLARAGVRALHALEILATVTPQFWLGAILILVFASGLGLLPATSGGSSPAGLVLPVITLAVPIAGFLAQVMRDALDEADSSPLATSARARGASEARLFWTHTLRHAALPVLALSGWAYGSLLSGAVVVESLFGRPGLGRLLLEGASVRDVPLVIGAVAMVAVVYVVVMAVVDLLDILVDPRLRRSRRGAAEVTIAAVG